MQDMVENCLTDEQNYEECVEILEKDKQLHVFLSITFLQAFSKV